MSSTILFVGHDAYRTGAEIALLHILTWLRAERQEEPRVLLRTGGELLADYERLAPTYRLEENPTLAGLAKRAFRRVHVIPRLHRVPSALRRERIDLVYLNTVAVAHLAPELKTVWHAPVLLHLRELEMAIRAYCGREGFRAALAHVDGCVTGTRVVADLLIERYGLARERIHRVSPGLALPDRGAAWLPEARLALRAKSDPHPHFALFDAFLLTSREDSFPFVCVEAAASGLPIVCFERSGGAPELVEDDAGFVVPYLDLDAAADRLALLMDDPALRHRLGEQAAARRVADTH